MARRDVLAKGLVAEDSKIDFLEDQEDVPEGETKHGEEANLLKIIYNSIADKYKHDAIVLRDAKRILRDCTYLAGDDIIMKARQNYLDAKMTESG